MKLPLFSIIIYIIFIFIFKEILILNEETIVALSFIIFVFLLYKNLNARVSEELENQAKLIEKELDAYWKEKEELLIKKIEFQKKQIELYRKLPILLNNLSNEVDKIYESKLCIYKTNIIDQLNNDFEELINNERVMIDTFHKAAVNWFIFWISFQYQCQVDKDTHLAIIRQNIKQLEEFGKNLKNNK